MSIAGLIQVYTADPLGAATPILVDGEAPPFTAQPVKVTLTVDCAQLCPPGWPEPPSMTGVEPIEWYPHLIRAGTAITCFANVAAALIAAGAAVAA